MGREGRLKGVGGGWILWGSVCPEKTAVKSLFKAGFMSNPCLTSLVNAEGVYSCFGRGLSVERENHPFPPIRVYLLFHSFLPCSHVPPYTHIKTSDPCEAANKSFKRNSRGAMRELKGMLVSFKLEEFQ